MIVAWKAGFKGRFASRVLKAYLQKTFTLKHWAAHDVIQSIPLHSLRIYFQALFATVFCFVILGVPNSYAGELARQQTEHTQVSVVSRYKQLIPGQVQYFALRLQPESGWHTYWRNPGEVGKATQVEWQLPKGIKAGELVWPMPKRKQELGGVSFVYPGSVLLPLAMAVGENLDFDQETHRFVAEVSWLVCKDVCIPESARLEFSMSVAIPSVNSESLLSDDAAAIEEAIASVPKLRRDIAAEFNANLDIRSKGVAGEQLSNLAIHIPTKSLPPFESKPVAYLTEQSVVDETQLAAVTVTNDTLTIKFSADPYLEELPPFLGVVLSGFSVDDGRHIELHVEHNPDLPVGSSATANTVQGAISTGENLAAYAGPNGLGLILLFAFLGGLILNAMPCVFPVLSLKIIGLVESGGDARHRYSHGLAYTAGVVISFVLVALVLIVLRSLGEQIGWGFQLQSPLFVALMVLVIFTLGLSLSGYIEFGSNLQNIGSSQVSNSKSPIQGAFWTGVLATVVATPCTAPFMGSAMGYALSQPVFISLAVFAVMGLGLASPFLLIAIVPAFGRWLPRPGTWMIRFKELLAFPLYLTAIWLIWVFARQAGIDAAAILLIALVLVVMTIWAFRASGVAWKMVAAIFAVLTIYSVYSATRIGDKELAFGEKPLTEQKSDKFYKSYSPETLSQALKTGDTVLVNMTADWCITCKVNERVALQNAKVADVLSSDGVQYIKGDWTNSDPDITDYLAQFGRSGVPLYVVYRAGESPQVLPQVLTPSMVLAAIRK